MTAATVGGETVGADTGGTETMRAETVHASAIAFGNQGALIVGAPGSGKSTLAIACMAIGARLVADDAVKLEATGTGLTMQAPRETSGLIEVRGVGLLRFPATVARCTLIVDLDARAERLPVPQNRVLLGYEIPVMAAAEGSERAARLWARLHADGMMDPDAPLGCA